MVHLKPNAVKVAGYLKCNKHLKSVVNNFVCVYLKYRRQQIFKFQNICY